MTTIRNILICVTIVLFSCGNNNQKMNEDNKQSSDFKKLDTIVSCSGYWLSEDYYNSIKSFGSPRKAQSGSQFLIIPERTLQLVQLIVNFHEGDVPLKVIKHNNKYEMWEAPDDTLTQLRNLVEIISETKIKLGERAFIKINPLKNKDNYQILEEVLFKGEYTNAESKSIEFKNDGQIVGLDNIKFYNPVIDYFDAGMQVDQVGLGNSPKEMEWYGFKFKQDTLELYKLNCLTYDKTDNRCMEVEFGQLLYKLWRK